MDKPIWEKLEEIGKTVPPETWEKEGVITFNRGEAYELFIAVDNLARVRRGEDTVINDIRDRLLPFYNAWHEANPSKIHPSSLRVDCSRYQGDECESPHCVENGCPWA